MHEKQEQDEEPFGIKHWAHSLEPVCLSANIAYICWALFQVLHQY